MTDMRSGSGPDLSIVIPVHDEAANIGALLDEIVRAMGGSPYEIVVVDDGSGDDTLAILRKAKASMPMLRVLRHERSQGQSTATVSGIRAARGTWIATLDGDGQNDPADIPNLIAARDRHPAPDDVLFAGYRKVRRDTRSKRISTRVANGVRGRLLRDRTPDTGCGLKLFRRDLFLELPHFNHVHRFLPALFIRHGGGVQSIEVNHRPRGGGRSHYGILDRLAVGIYDLLGVMWLLRRPLRARAQEDTGVAE